MTNFFLKSKRLLTVVFAVAMGASISVRASEDPEQIAARNLFMRSALTLPKALREKGIHQFLGVDLDQLDGEIQSLEVVYFAGANVFGKAPEGYMRVGAANFRKGDRGLWARRKKVKAPTVVLNYASLLTFQVNSRITQIKNVFHLHEALGALGYADDRYELALGMWAATRMNSEWALAYATHSRSGFDLLAGSGGASGSGKGGDPEELWFRAVFVSWYLKKVESENDSPDVKQARVLNFLDRLARMTIRADMNRSGTLCDREKGIFEVQSVQGRTEIVIYGNEISVFAMGYGDGKECQDLLVAELNRMSEYILGNADK